MPFDDVFPNLFIALIARTTTFHKTTGMKIAHNIALQVFPHLLAPQEFTPEALVSELAGMQPTNYDDLPDDAQKLWIRQRDFAAQRGIFIDEFSALLTGAGREYNAGLLDFLNRLYDAPTDYQRTTRGQGLVVVRNAYVSFLGGSTPAALSTYLVGQRLWTNGWWPRFALLTPVGWPPWKMPNKRRDADNITRQLAQLCKRLPSPSWPKSAQPMSATLSDGARVRWEHFSKWSTYDVLQETGDERLDGVYGRLPMQALKVAALLAAIDWANQDRSPEAEIVITERHMLRALGVAERWRVSAHRLLEEVVQQGGAQLGDRIVAQLQRAQTEGRSGLTGRELERAIPSVKRTKMNAELVRLVRDGEIESVDWKNPKGGAKTIRFRLAGMDGQATEEQG
ncbi:MAG TPA: DUF3987 domain-containing protein, partial [Anaerolineaceae bacterium]|nr:DUF3987 domain-containing protein [Anaerolineaceae bacterium]